MDGVVKAKKYLVERILAYFFHVAQVIVLIRNINFDTQLWLLVLKIVMMIAV